MNRLILIICLSLLSLGSFAQYDMLENQILSIMEGKKASIGVAVNFDGKDLIAINDGEQYPMQSVYKLHLAMAVLDHMEKNKLPMNTQIHIKKEDLLPGTHSPLRDKHPEGDIKLPISELLKYTVSESDNNTGDILIGYLGGPEKVESYIKAHGIEKVAICCNDKDIHENHDALYTNWTTPSEAVKVIELFREKEFLSKANNKYLKKLLTESTTGADKIKCYLPDNLVIGHKTGSSLRNAEGVKGADNDIGFVTLPDGSGYSLAIFVKDSKEDDKTNADIIARISRVIFEFYIQQGMY